MSHPEAHREEGAAQRPLLSKRNGRAMVALGAVLVGLAAIWVLMKSDEPNVVVHTSIDKSVPLPTDLLPADRLSALAAYADPRQPASTRLPDKDPRRPAGSAAAGSRTAPEPEITTPTRIKDVPPVYPQEAKEARVSGAVIVELHIGSDGKVTKAIVRKSIPLLDAAALAAIRQWEFTPMLLNGVPVPTLTNVTVQFTLTEPD